MTFSSFERKKALIKQKRYERILHIIEEQHAVSIEDICDQLGVSKATVRRDLIYLDEQKLLKRTHGGAVSFVKPAIENVPLALRHQRNTSEKARIAHACLQQIQDGSTLYIGSGSTMRELSSQLHCFSKLTILTNDIGVANEISQNTTNHLIVSGGMLKQSTATLVGTLAENSLKDLRVHTAVLSADSISAEGFMDLNTEEVAIKRMMIKQSDRSIMLCDQSKFGQKAFMTICPLTDIDLAITNDELEPEYERALVDAGLVLQSV